MIIPVQSGVFRAGKYLSGIFAAKEILRREEMVFSMALPFERIPDFREK